MSSNESDSESSESNDEMSNGDILPPGFDDPNCDPYRLVRRDIYIFNIILKIFGVHFWEQRVQVVNKCIQLCTFVQLLK